MPAVEPIPARSAWEHDRRPIPARSACGQLRPVNDVRLTRGAASGAVATLVAALAIVGRHGDARFVAALAAAGVVLLAIALFRARPDVVAPAVGLLALAVVGGNGTTRVAVPFEAAALVTVALLAWWSIDERDLAAGAPSVDRRRWLTASALVLMAAGVAALVLATSTAASADVIAPVAGAVGVVSITATVWALMRWQRFLEDSRR